MGKQDGRDSAERLASYLDGLADVIGHAARIGPKRDYCTGLLLSCKRKSVEPRSRWRRHPPRPAPSISLCCTS